MKKVLLLFVLAEVCSAACVPFAARLEPYRHCRILSSSPETRSWLYENLRKYLEKSWGQSPLMQ